ncbi:MAG: DUF4835 family protein [Prevotellaceae bacterium]|jgi:hypothetical protein|nr:DUF4835 family protein [Prevotellaceae bacterium]
MKKIILYLLFILPLSASAQELKCNVSVSRMEVEGTNNEVFVTLQKAITEYMNNRHWTEMQMSVNERIECSINIIVSKQSTTENFDARIQVQARRPVYGASYSTTLLNFEDKDFSFRYKEFEPLEFNENDAFSDNTNLTAVLAYYAYLIIGLDSDSFSSFGGTPYFQKAENIVNQAQSSSWGGWRAYSGRNRYEIINNIMDERLRKYREFFYQYHRLGLDEMAKSPANARARIAQNIIVLREVNRNKPMSMALQMFFETKCDELVSIFSEGTDKEKKDVRDLLVEIDGVHSSKYDKIIQK